MSHLLGPTRAIQCGALKHAWLSQESSFLFDVHFTPDMAKFPGKCSLIPS